MFAIKEPGRARRNRRLLASLTGILALITIYWALPAVIAEFLRLRLALAGFDQIVVNSGRPSWSELSLDTIQVSRRSGNRILTLRAAGLTFRYQPLRLLSGRFISIRAAKAELESSFIGDGSSAQDNAGENIGPIAFVPGHWLSRLPADELYLERLDLHFQAPAGGRYTTHAAAHVRNGQGTLTGEILPEEGNPFTFSAHAAGNGEFELDIRASGSSAPPVLHVAVRTDEIEKGQLNVDGSAQARFDAIAGLLRPWFGSDREFPILKGSVESRWQGTIPVVDGTWKGVKIRSDHNLRITTESPNGAFRYSESSIEASARIEGSRINWHIGNQSKLSARFKGKMNSRREPGVVMTFPKGLAGLVELAPEQLTFNLTPGFPVHLASVDWQGISSSGIDIELADNVKLRYDSKPTRWTSEPFALSTGPVSLNWPNGEIETDAISVRIDEFGGENADWKGKGELRVAGLKPKIHGKSLPAGNVLIKFRGDSKQLDLESAVTLSQGMLLLNGRARHQVASGRGSAQFELAPIVFGESGLALSRLLEPWPYPVDFHAGRIAAFGSSSWFLPAGQGAGGPPRFENELTIEVNGLAGRFKTIGFEELDARLALTDQDGSRTIDPARLRIGQLDLGIPITDLNVEAAVTSHSGKADPIIDIRQFGGNLLDGTVHSGPFRWDTAHPSPPVILSLRGLSLSQIIALEKRHGVEGYGLLDGYLPLEITKTHVVLRRGELQARPPGGWIRYRPTEEVKAMAKDNVSLQFVNQALSNLQYKTLKVRADSTPKGDLTLRVELRGHNPEWQSGRPIHLNLNLQENLLMLLRSLSIADDLTDRMNRQIQEHYRKKH
jgi:hypothetical protein